MSSKVGLKNRGLLLLISYGAFSKNFWGLCFCPDWLLGLNGLIYPKAGASAIFSGGEFGSFLGVMNSLSPKIYLFIFNEGKLSRICLKFIWDYFVGVLLNKIVGLKWLPLDFDLAIGVNRSLIFFDMSLSPLDEDAPEISCDPIFLTRQSKIDEGPLLFPLLSLFTRLPWTLHSSRIDLELIGLIFCGALTV